MMRCSAHVLLVTGSDWRLTSVRRTWARVVEPNSGMMPENGRKWIETWLGTWWKGTVSLASARRRQHLRSRLINPRRRFSPWGIRRCVSRNMNLNHHISHNVLLQPRIYSMNFQCTSPRNSAANTTSPWGTVTVHRGSSLRTSARKRRKGEKGAKVKVAAEGK